MQYSKRLIAVYLGGILCVLTATTGNCGTNIIATVGDSGIPTEEFETYVSNMASSKGYKIDYITPESMKSILEYYSSLEVVFLAGLKIDLHKTGMIKDLIIEHFMETSVMDLDAAPVPETAVKEKSKLAEMLIPLKVKMPSADESDLVFQAAMNANAHRHDLIRGRIIFAYLKKKNMDLEKAINALKPAMPVKINENQLSALKHNPSKKRNTPPDGGIGFMTRNPETGKLSYKSQIMYDGFTQWWGVYGRPETFEVQTKKKPALIAIDEEKKSTPEKTNPRQDLIDRPTPLGGEIDYASGIRDKLVKKSKQSSAPPRNIIIFAVIAGLMLTGLSYYRRMNS